LRKECLGIPEHEKSRLFYEIREISKFRYMLYKQLRENQLRQNTNGLFNLVCNREFAYIKKYFYTSKEHIRTYKRHIGIRPKFWFVDRGHRPTKGVSIKIKFLFTIPKMSNKDISRAYKLLREYPDTPMSLDGSQYKYERRETTFGYIGNPTGSNNF
jgi:hypothetical protein